MARCSCCGSPIELIELIKESLDDEIERCQERLREYHAEKINQNSYGVGYECGARDVCVTIKDLIEEALKNESD